MPSLSNLAMSSTDEDADVTDNLSLKRKFTSRLDIWEQVQSICSDILLLRYKLLCLPAGAFFVILDLSTDKLTNAIQCGIWNSEL